MKRIALIGLLALAGCQPGYSDRANTAAALMLMSGGLRNYGAALSAPQPMLYQPMTTMSCQNFGGMVHCNSY